MNRKSVASVLLLALLWLAVFAAAMIASSPCVKASDVGILGGDPVDGGHPSVWGVGVLDGNLSEPCGGDPVDGGHPK